MNIKNYDYYYMLQTPIQKTIHSLAVSPIENNKQAAACIYAIAKLKVFSTVSMRNSTDYTERINLRALRFLYQWE